MTSPAPPASDGFARACELDALGRREAARAEYLAFLAGAPTHFGALNNLGTLLYESGYRSAARTAYEEAVRYHPDNPVGHINLANLLLASGELAGCRRHYETALALAPDHDEAHRGLANLLAELGEDEAAETHRRAAYRDRAVVAQRYRGTTSGIPLLLLVSGLGGNVPTRLLIDDGIFEVTVLVADYADPATPLPPHRLVFNAIGDADLSPRALAVAARLLAATPVSVVNPPRRILATGRAEIARRFAGAPGIVAPRMVSLPRATLESTEAAALLARHGLAFPLLLRSPGHHTGRHFLRVDDPASLGTAVATLPGREIMAIELLDARGADGLARKYRVMIVDGRLYPLHLAISADWKVHYFTAAMAEHPAHRGEEAAFLADMPAVLGPRAMAALAQIRDALGLDYGGIDFGLARDGALLLFEANSTMVVNPPDSDPRWDYRRAPIERVLDAARAMLRRLAQG